MKSIGKRIIIVFFLFILSFSIVYVQIINIININSYKSVSSNQSLYSINIGEQRGYIYDRHLRPIVNTQIHNVLSVIPMPNVLTTLKTTLNDDDFNAILPSLESGKPTKIVTNEHFTESLGLNVYQIPERYEDEQIAPHIIGYLNNEKNGVYGIEKGYNDFLKEMGGKVKLTYNVNAYGNALGNDIEKIVDTRYGKYSQGGVILTIDKDIQKISEKAMTDIKKGACVVMDINTGEIMAMVSKPTFSQNDMQTAINDKNGALFNRAIAAYNVGSTFKTIISAAALEQGISTEHKEICSGKYTLNDITFGCHQRSGHWEIDMWQAMAHSCNVYFIELGQKIGANSIIDIAEKIGFGKEMKLAEGIVASSGTIPQKDTITKGEFCNLCFGQGLLTATPIQITAMMSTVANGGYAVNPTLYKGLTNDGYSIYNKQIPEKKERVFSTNTAKTLNELLSDVVINGSGKEAQSNFCTCAGKTGSAQTGQFINNNEVVHGWFAGFFPTEDPKYAITIFEEGGGNGADKPAKVFKEIADNVTLLTNPALNCEYYSKK